MSNKETLKHIFNNKGAYHRYVNKMIDRDQWICWKFESNGNGKQTKVPKNPHDGRNASTNKKETWSDFETTYAAMVQSGFDGIGYVFTKDDGLVGIDLDHCIDDKGHNSAKDIIDHFSSYTEISPSGDGVHIIIEGNLPKWSENKNTQKGYEAYESGRFFTFTGQPYNGHWKWIAKRNRELEAFCNEHLRKDSGSQVRDDSGSINLNDQEGTLRVFCKPFRLLPGHIFCKAVIKGAIDDRAAQLEHIVAVGNQPPGS